MIRWKSIEDVVNCPSFELAWESRYAKMPNLYAMYHSPEWLSCFKGVSTQKVSVAVCHTPSQMVSRPTYAVLRKREVDLVFGLSPAIKFALPIKALELLGSDVLGEGDVEHLHEIIEGCWKRYPSVDAIYLKSVQQDSSLWRFFEANHWQIGGASIYMPDALRSFHYIELPSTYEEYLKGFRAKQRYTLKKKVRRLYQSFVGQVEIQEVNNPCEIEALVEKASQVIDNSWKAKHLKAPLPNSIRDIGTLHDIAGMGMLKSHLMLINGEPSAFIVGYLYKGIYHYADLAYDLKYRDYSPGTVLLHKVIENMFDSQQTVYVNFGITDAQYKQVFGNRHVQDAGMLLIRRRFSNILKVGIHRLFRGSKVHVKQLRDHLMKRQHPTQSAM